MRYSRMFIISCFSLLFIIQSVWAISDVQHSVDGNKVTLTYQVTPPFYINIRPDANLGQEGGYLWGKTYYNSFTYDMSFATNPSKKFYYGVKDIGWSNTNSFSIGQSSNTPKNTPKYFGNIGYILIVDNKSNDNEVAITKVKMVKDSFPKVFNEATLGLGTISVSEDVFIIEMNKDFNIGDELQNIINQFYKTNEDNFEYLAIYTSFTPQGNSQLHFTIKNNVTGFGLSTFDVSELYGSKGRLEGVGYLKGINQYDLEQKSHVVVAMNMQLHEIIGHRYVCYLRDLKVGDEPICSGPHYYPGLSVPDDYKTFGSPMGARSWYENADGTYSALDYDGSNPTIYKFHPFTLYFMGLTGEENYDTRFNVYYADNIYYGIGVNNGVIIGSISIRDIINVYGKREEVS